MWLEIREASSASLEERDADHLFLLIHKYGPRAEGILAWASGSSMIAGGSWGNRVHLTRLSQCEGSDSRYVLFLLTAIDDESTEIDDESIETSMAFVSLFLIRRRSAARTCRSQPHGSDQGVTREVTNCFRWLLLSCSAPAWRRVLGTTLVRCSISTTL
jgi:hypothetical protein